MDLTKTYPRSVREKMLGVVQLPRTADKAKALAFGNIGEYHYNCPMDKAVFTFLGIDHEAFLDAVKTSKDESGVEAFVRPYVQKKSSDEIERWNQQWLNRKPEGESLDFFLQLRNQIAPERTDVTTWTDLLDLDEKRNVPKRNLQAA